MFCQQCGHPLTDGAAFCGHCGAKAVGSNGREEVLQAVAAALSPYSQLVLTWGQKTDLEIANELAAANWAVGKKRIEYSARLRVDTAAKTVVFWEMIKEEGLGLGGLFSFKTETYRSDGKTRTGRVSETAYGLGGKGIDYNWDYAQVRGLVESAVRSRGWEFTTVLLKGKASY